jgi:hypothetical protein
METSAPALESDMEVDLPRGSQVDAATIPDTLLGPVPPKPSKIIRRFVEFSKLNANTRSKATRTEDFVNKKWPVFFTACHRKKERKPVDYRKKFIGDLSKLKPTEDVEFVQQAVQEFLAKASDDVV